MHMLKARSFRLARVSPLVLTLCAGIALTGCVKNIHVRGYLADSELVSDLIPGVDNRDSVRSALGSPSSMGVFDDDTWYYFSRRTKSIAFFQPKIIQQNILAVSFDADGNVEQLHTYTLADSRQVKIVKRETPTRGRKLGLLEQLFGNIGRFANQNRGNRVPGSQQRP